MKVLQKNETTATAKNLRIQSKSHNKLGQMEMDKVMKMTMTYDICFGGCGYGVE